MSIFLSQSRHAMVFWTRYSVKIQCSASESPQRQSFPSLSLERQNVSRRPSERNSNLCQSCKVYIPIPWSPPFVFYAACVCVRANACECFVKRPRVHVGGPCTRTPSPRRKSPCPNPYTCDTRGSGDAFRFRICNACESEGPC